MIWFVLIGKHPARALGGLGSYALLAFPFKPSACNSKLHTTPRTGTRTTTPLSSRTLRTSSSIRGRNTLRFHCAPLSRTLQLTVVQWNTARHRPALLLNQKHRKNSKIGVGYLPSCRTGEGSPGTGWFLSLEARRAALFPILPSRAASKAEHSRT